MAILVVIGILTAVVRWSPEKVGPKRENSDLSQLARAALPAGGRQGPQRARLDCLVRLEGRADSEVEADSGEPKVRAGGLATGRFRMKSIVVRDEAAGTAGMTPAVRPGPDSAGNDVVVLVMRRDSPRVTRTREADACLGAVLVRAAVYAGLIGTGSRWGRTVRSDGFPARAGWPRPSSPEVRGSGRVSGPVADRKERV